MRSGKPTVFMQRLVQQSLMKRIGGLPPNGVDFISVDGAANLPYDIPNVRMEYTEHDPGIPFGFWRSVGASFQGFVDRGVHRRDGRRRRGRIRIEFRRDLLGKAPASSRRRSIWRPRRPAGASRCPRAACRGIAVMECFGSILAQVTEVSVDAQRHRARAQGRLHRRHAAG